MACPAVSGDANVSGPLGVCCGLLQLTESTVIVIKVAKSKLREFIFISENLRCVIFHTFIAPSKNFRRARVVSGPIAVRTTSDLSCHPWQPHFGSLARSAHAPPQILRS